MVGMEVRAGGEGSFGSELGTSVFCKFFRGAESVRLGEDRNLYVSMEIQVSVGEVGGPVDGGKKMNGHLEGSSYNCRR